MTLSEDEPACTIRPAVPADAAAIAEIHVSAWQAAYRGIVPDHVLDGLSVARHTGEWQHHFATPEEHLGDRVFVAEEGAVVGFALTAPAVDRDLDSQAVLELVAIYIHPSCWGRGLGRRLVAACRDDARERRFTSVCLWVLLGNRRAQRLYDRLGFRPDGRHELRHIGGADLPTRRYRLSIIADP